MSSKNITAQIQTNLKKLGFYNGIADGVTGPKTRQSIADFQKSKGLPKDVVISEKILLQTEEALR